MKKAICVFLLLFLFAGGAKADLKIWFLDVGQGDASIIQCDGETMVIDGGSPGHAAFMGAFPRDRLNLSHVDYVVSTHPHRDHVGGLDGVLSSVSADLLLTPVTEWDSAEFQEMMAMAEGQGTVISVPREGDTLALGGATVTVVSCWPDAWTENDMSICLRIIYGETAFLFTGDAEYMAEFLMVDHNPDLSADVLKVGHHGSDTSSTPEFLRAVAPEYAVISCGRDNEYGHPSQATLDALNAVGATVYRTDLDGTITCVSNGKKIAFRTGDIPLYVLNANTMKFHYFYCESVKDILPKNRVDYPGHREDAIARGYTPCKRCSP